MPRAPITPSVVAGPVGRVAYTGQDVAQVQPQQPGMLVQQGQQLQRLGGALEDVAEVQRLKQVHALAVESDTKFAEAARTRKSDFGKLQGRAAVDGFKDYEKALRDSAANLLQGVDDPTAKRVIQERADARIQQELNWATAHRDQQQEVWLKGSTTSAFQGATEDYKIAVANGDPDADRFFGTALLYRSQLDKMEGLDEKQQRITKLAATTMLHGGAVDGMIERKEFGKATEYLAKHKGEIAQDFFDNRAKQATAGVLEDMARNAFLAADNYTDRKRLIDEAEDLSPDDQRSALRNLQQLQANEDRENARLAVDVEARMRQWQAEHPMLDVMVENPALASEITKYGVDPKRTRTTDQAWLDDFYAAPTEALDSLRALDDNQLHRKLASVLSPHDEATVTKFLRGDQSGASIGERTTILARQLGILPNTGRDAQPSETRAFNAWVAGTIDPLIRKTRDQLKRDLNTEDFQKLIVDPIMRDKVWQEVTGRDQQLPLMRLQQTGAAPVDDPLTPADESLDFAAYNSLYVNVGGQQVMLREVPLEQRKKIRDAWSVDHPGVQMTVEAEIAEWVKNGRIGDLKPKFDAESKTAGMVDKAEWPVQIGPSRLDHVWSDGKSIRQGSTAAPK